MKALSIVVAMLLASSVPAHADEPQKGSVKPNWWLADLGKRDEAYYLTLEQVRVGWTQEQVLGEYGKKYKVVDSKKVNGQSHETWKFASYRARQFGDPIDSFVTVEFIDGLLVRAEHVPAPGSDVVRAELPAPDATRPAVAGLAPADRLAQLKDLLDRGLITADEYESKRAEIVSDL